MELGAFSVSLSVADMEKSMAFYRKLGFQQVGCDGESWTILRSDQTTIGLFHGMFEGNILTFNPGWSPEAEPLESFTDIREVRNELLNSGVSLQTDTTGDSESGPASFTLLDPDGNAILVDQHV